METGSQRVRHRSGRGLTEGTGSRFTFNTGVFRFPTRLWEQHSRSLTFMEMLQAVFCWTQCCQVCV